MAEAHASNIAPHLVLPLDSNKIAVGRVLARRELATVAGPRLAIPDPDALVHLQFRRFAGCPVCNIHLRSMARRQAEIRGADIREIVVFHSSAEALAAHVPELPFALVADPEKCLYVEFGVEAAPRALLDPRAWPAILRAIVMGTVATLARRLAPPPLDPEGGRFGLPADFLIAPDGRVLARKYGEHADDQWSVDELLAIAAATRSITSAQSPG